MTVAETNFLIKKAEKRADGVYLFGGICWAVKNGRFIGFVNDDGQLLQRAGAFNTLIGDLSAIDRRYWKKKLLEWLQTQR